MLFIACAERGSISTSAAAHPTSYWCMAPRCCRMSWSMWIWSRVWQDGSDLLCDLHVLFELPLCCCIIFIGVVQRLPTTGGWTHFPGDWEPIGCRQILEKGVSPHVFWLKIFWPQIKSGMNQDYINMLAKGFNIQNHRSMPSTIWKS